MKALATSLSNRETDKNLKRRSTYLRTVKDKRDILEKAIKPLKAQLKKLQTELGTRKNIIDAIEANVFKEPRASKKQAIRTAGKWKVLVAGFYNREKVIAEQQKKVNEQKRKIDLLYGGRVGQIWRNLDEELKVFRDRKRKPGTIIKMPKLP
ncbi:hypothetical protein EKO04_003862 [Ascochyta lentis]|uniref:Uncharacterized protein n=1 Tax=Ascochyta lentis TaxID=205686 RepID=A0A8H7J9M1_9PLEO|nr:hypothetical protein EKO04_003862 [Ascochyta lentis]